MAIKIKSADVIASKYASRGAAATADYTTGVQNPRQDWMTATEAAAPTYAAGVQAAITNNLFQKGVSKAGTSKWQQKASSVGAQRFGPGITAAKPFYQAGVAPFLDVIANLTLPPRLPKGDPGNVQRVAVIAAALRAKKLQG